LLTKFYENTFDICKKIIHALSDVGAWEFDDPSLALQACFAGLMKGD
jgi:hypothetical protein